MVEADLLRRHRAVVELVDAIEGGLAQIDAAVRRILEAKFCLGLFDDPYRYINSKREKAMRDRPDHLAAARDVARKSIVLIKNEEIAKAGPGPLRIEVLAQQFAWEFTYPDLGVTTGDLRVPVDRQVILNLRSKDVIHDFFVYETRIKGDAVPGIVNDLVRFTMKPEYAGSTYPIICSELCGSGHSVMRAQMLTLSQGDYATWAADAKADAAAAKAAAPPPPPPPTPTP